MRKIKTIFVVFIAVLMILSTAGCSKKGKETGNTQDNDIKPTETVTPSPSDKNTVSEKPTETPTAAPAQSEDSDLEGLLKKSNTGDNFSWYCITEYNGTKMSYKYYVKGKKERLELFNDETSSMVLYIDGEKNTTYLYDSKNKSAMKMVDSSIQNTALKPQDFLYNATQGNLAGYKNKGKENVEGMDCTVYEYEYDTNKIKIYVWDKYDTLVKMETFENDKMNSSYLLKDFQVGKVTDDMVTIPKDVKITDVSS